MGQVKNFISVLAQSLGKEFDEVTEDDIETAFKNKQDISFLNKEDYTIFCIQTGTPCGYPCNGDCEKNGVIIVNKK